MTDSSADQRIAYLGPAGTFTEEALLDQTDLSLSAMVPLATISDVLAATSGGRVDLGFVAIENSIEGTVRPTIDTLVFEADLLIQREVVIDIDLNLLGLPGTDIEQIRTVLSHQMAIRQCENFVAHNLPKASAEVANSTAHAARRVLESGDPSVAVIGNSLLADVYQLDIMARHVEDHEDNQTRFVLVGRDGVPAPTGHDKTSIAVFQRANEPGSLLTILQEFAARGIDLTKLESRPTKKALDDYCFMIDFRGHISNEVIADALRELKITQQEVKFLGSYPAAGERSRTIRRDAESEWVAAAKWLEEIQAVVGSGVPAP